MINFESIIKRSFKIIKNNRFLWFLGLLAGGASFGSNNFNYLFNSNNGNGNFQKLKDIVPNGGSVATIVSAEVKDMGQVLGSSIGPSSVGNVYIWVILLIIVIAIILALIYISLTARGALIKSTIAIEGGERVGLSKAWNMGHKLFWRRFSFAILWFLIMFVPFIILAIPIIILAIFELKVMAIVLGIIFGLAFLVYAIYLSLTFPVAERVLFLQGKGTAESIRTGMASFNRNWQNFVLSYLVVFGFGIGLGIAIVILLLVMGLFIVGVGLIFYVLAHWVGIVFWSVLGFVALIILLTISGVSNSFFSSVLTLAYKDIRAKQ